MTAVLNSTRRFSPMEGYQPQVSLLSQVILLSFSLYYLKWVPCPPTVEIPSCPNRNTCRTSSPSCDLKHTFLTRKALTSLYSLLPNTCSHSRPPSHSQIPWSMQTYIAVPTWGFRPRSKHLGGQDTRSLRRDCIWNSL